jgi:hypothetical protein
MDQAALPRFFELFTLSPTEIQLEILSHCSVADLVCVSLASHSLRALVLPHIPAKPSLLMVEQLGSSPCWDCEEKASKEEPLVQHESPARPCPCTNHKGVRYDPRMHRRKIHSFMDAPRYGYWNYASRRYSSNHATCQVPRCKKHCACISCPLFTRLRGWMGDDLRYCSQCEKFTRRLKKYKGRCEYKPDYLAILRLRSSLQREQACMVNPKFGKRPTITGPGPVGFLGDAGGGRDGEPMELAMRLIMG